MLRCHHVKPHLLGQLWLHLGFIVLKHIVAVPHRHPDVRWPELSGWNISHHDNNRKWDWSGSSACRPGSATLAYRPSPDGPLTALDHGLPTLCATPWAIDQTRLPASWWPRWLWSRRSRSHAEPGWWAAAMAVQWAAEALLCGQHRLWPIVSGVAKKVMNYFMCKEQMTVSLHDIVRVLS